MKIQVHLSLYSLLRILQGYIKNTFHAATTVKKVQERITLLSYSIYAMIFVTSMA